MVPSNRPPQGLAQTWWLARGFMHISSNQLLLCKSLPIHQFLKKPFHFLDFSTITYIELPCLICRSWMCQSSVNSTVWLSCLLPVSSWDTLLLCICSASSIPDSVKSPCASAPECFLWQEQEHTICLWWHPLGHGSRTCLRTWQPRWLPFWVSGKLILSCFVLLIWHWSFHFKPPLKSHFSEM
jgi:hypothetical protein